MRDILITDADDTLWTSPDGSRRREQRRLHPYVEYVLMTAKKRKVHVVVLSDASVRHVDYRLTEFELDYFVDHVIGMPSSKGVIEPLGQYEVTTAEQEKPETILETILMMPTREISRRAIMVGDSKVDMLLAERYDIPGLYAQYGDRRRLRGPILNSTPFVMPANCFPIFNYGMVLNHLR